MIRCKCNKPAQHLVTIKSNHNQGRWFYTCQTKTCQFFAWDDDTPQQPSNIGGITSSNNTIASISPTTVGTGNPLVKCRCNKPARHLVTKKLNENHGRWFYNCSTNLCGFFLWDDGTPRQLTTATTSDTFEQTTIRNNIKPSIHFFVKSTTQIAIYLNGLNVHDEKRLLNLMNGFIMSYENGTWLIPTTKEAYRHAIQTLTQQQTLSSTPTFDILPLPANVIKVLDDGIGMDKEQQQQHDNVVDAINQEDGKDDSYVEDKEEFNECMKLVQDLDLWPELVSYQREGVKKGIQWRGRLLLGDEMDLGKTVQAIAIAYSYLDEWPVLVVCPSSVRITWKNELLRWTDIVEHEIGIITQGIQMAQLPKKKQLKATTTDDTHSIGASPGGSFSNSKGYGYNAPTRVKRPGDNNDDASNNIKFWVTSYDLATRRICNIVDAEFKIVICDESHYIKNFSAKRTQALVPVLKKAKRVLLLTGTPALSRPIELFSQMSALRPDIFTSEEQFGERYCGGLSARDGWGRKYTGAQYLEELHFLLTKTILVRRLKEDVGDQLPKKRRQVVLMDVATLMKKSLTATRKKISSIPIASEERKGTILQWFSDSGKAKIPVVQQYIEHTLDHTNDKMVIFAYHHSMLNAIEQCVSKKQTAFIRIDGSTRQSLRQPLCDAFQAPDSKIRVAILSLVIGFGLNLSAADLVLFAELYWNPAHLLQAEDRAHRTGRVGPVTVIYILSMDTIDSFLWPLVKRKLEIIGPAIDGDSHQVNLNERSSSIPDWFGKDDDFLNVEDIDNDNNKYLIESSSSSH
ncbi:P-loop containing nucleoside triphosphate hydrolase protein [Phascolomyces articulosus]|uniref:P-loop containing nucleoside triphosphate hydrolase protein n=1 Tax=Phascolomyces articulosus TaxID=60185 RepID=A0AAD5JVQ0_9FUNG|nr:P-loop containing nucleoside triphosphate hydrolase protein [Phascolomyces articulosus]